MPNVVINLERHPERWASIAPQFAALRLPVTRLPAVDGARLDPAMVERLYSPSLNLAQYHQPLRHGEIGCYASHIAAWQRLLASPDPCLAVFEDDVDLERTLPQVLDAIDRTTLPFDLVKLVGRPHEKIASRTASLGPCDLVRYRRVPGLTSGYVVSRRGAEKLLALRVPFGRPIDIDLRHHWECGLTILGAHPYPLRPAATSRSTSIEGRRGAADAGTRWRKLVLQARYSLLNVRHAAAVPDAEIPAAGSAVATVNPPRRRGEPPMPPLPPAPRVQRRRA